VVAVSLNESDGPAQEASSAAAKARHNGTGVDRGVGMECIITSLRRRASRG